MDRGPTIYQIKALITELQSENPEKFAQQQKRHRLSLLGGQPARFDSLPAFIIRRFSAAKATLYRAIHALTPHPRHNFVVSL